MYFCLQSFQCTQKLIGSFWKKMLPFMSCPTSVATVLWTVITQKFSAFCHICLGRIPTFPEGQNFRNVPCTISLVTARVRITREGTVFTGVCLSTFRGVPHHRSRQRGVPCPRARWGRYPIPGPTGGVPHPANWGGSTPPQVQVAVPYPADDGEGYPMSRWGIPHPADGGVPHPRSRWEVSHPADAGYSIPGSGGGYPTSRTGWGTPPPSKTGWGSPSQETEQHSKHLLHGGRYALVFTQEDFMVFVVNLK